MAYMRLGDLLISAGVIRPEQLNEALAIQKKTRERLGDVLINNGIITEQQLIEALQMQLGVDFVDLTAVSIPLELARFVPRSIAKKYCVVPVKLQKDELYVAMTDPLNFEAQEEIKSASHKQVVPMIATRRAVEQAIATLYGSEGTARAIEEMKREVGSNQTGIVPVQMSKTVDNGAAEAPTIRFVNSVIERAITERASDIHLEPQEGEMVVWMRIDGVLRRVFTVPANLQATVIARLKIMGGMNIAERKIPQDGRAMVTAKDKEVFPPSPPFTARKSFCVCWTSPPAILTGRPSVWKGRTRRNTQRRFFCALTDAASGRFSPPLAAAGSPLCAGPSGRQWRPGTQCRLP